MKKAKFSKGMKVRVVKTHLDDLELEHAKYAAAANGEKALPYTEIHHDAGNDRYHISTRGRGKSIRNADHTLPERAFLHHALRLLKGNPKLHPAPKEASINTDTKRKVTIHLGHPDYGMYDRTAKKVRAINKQRDAFLRDRAKGK